MVTDQNVVIIFSGYTLGCFIACVLLVCGLATAFNLWLTKMVNRRDARRDLAWRKRQLEKIFTKE